MLALHIYARARELGLGHEVPDKLFAERCSLS
jgi:hypothetical protein